MLGYSQCSKQGCGAVGKHQDMFQIDGNPYCFRHVSSTSPDPIGVNYPLERVLDILECGNVMAGLLALYAIGEVFEDY